MNERLFATSPQGTEKMYTTSIYKLGRNNVYFGYILENGKKSGIINLSSVVAANPRWNVVDEFSEDTDAD